MNKISVTAVNSILTPREYQNPKWRWWAFWTPRFITKVEPCGARLTRKGGPDVPRDFYTGRTLVMLSGQAAGITGSNRDWVKVDFIDWIHTGDGVIL